MAEVPRVRVTLLGSRAAVWRLIEIDADLSLDRVHAALQIVMGWENAHLHDFTDVDPNMQAEMSAPHRWGPAFLREDDEELLPEEDISLGEILTVDQPLFYEYDFGDRWLHRLEVIEIRTVSPSRQRVTVVRGEGRCPLENSGGIGSYEQLLTVLAEPPDEEYDEYAGWVEGMTGEPVSLFNPEAANRLLQEQFPTSGPVAE